MIRYELDYGECKDTFKVNDMISDFCEKLHTKTGASFYRLQLESCITSNKSIDESYLANKELQTLNEEVLWKNMKVQEKFETIKKHLNNIHCDKSSHMYIVDPYLMQFGEDDEEYKELLRLIFNEMDLKKLSLFISTKLPNGEVWKGITSSPPSDITVYRTNVFHDRIWINIDTQESFIMGTSLSGLGKKISIIQEYNEKEDIRDIISFIQKKIVAR